MRQTRRNDKQLKHSRYDCAFLMHWWAHRRTLRKVGEEARTPKNTSGLSKIALREEQYEEFKQACDSAEAYEGVHSESETGVTREGEWPR